MDGPTVSNECCWAALPALHVLVSSLWQDCKSRSADVSLGWGVQDAGLVGLWIWNSCGAACCSSNRDGFCTLSRRVVNKALPCHRALPHDKSRWAGHCARRHTVGLVVRNKNVAATMIPVRVQLICFQSPPSDAASQADLFCFLPRITFLSYPTSYT